MTPNRAKLQVKKTAIKTKESQSSIYSEYGLGVG